jgi:hypothetical protein
VGTHFDPDTGKESHRSYTFEDMNVGISKEYTERIAHNAGAII